MAMNLTTDTPKPREDAAVPLDQIVAEWREWREAFPGLTASQARILLLGHQSALLEAASIIESLHTPLVTVTPPRRELTPTGPITHEPVQTQTITASSPN
jgi:hypothetical protein